MAPAGLKGSKAKNADVSKNNISILSLYKHKKETNILNWNFFLLLQTTYLHESLQGFKSSLAQSDGELPPVVKFTPEWLLREQNFGHFLVFEP